MRQREQTILQGLEKLEDKHTLERGVELIEEQLGLLSSPEDLMWFLRLSFDPRKPLVAAWARREQLLLLPKVVNQFNSACSEAPISALLERALQLLVVSLRCSDTLEATNTAFKELIDCLVPQDTAPEDLPQRFLQMGRALLHALMDPLSLGGGHDWVVKRRCVTVLAASTPVLLKKARLCLDVEPGNPEVTSFLEVFTNLLVQCLTAAPGLQEGLLQCLALLAADDATGEGLAAHAKGLVELCSSHLLETPSAAPAYVPPRSGDAAAAFARSESPTRGGVSLTRDLALTCCMCLRHLAALVLPLEGEEVEAPEELQRLRQHVTSALHRDNLNLHRLTRGHESLRRSIALARQAWEEMGSEATARRARRVASPGRRRTGASSSKASSRGLAALQAFLEEGANKRRGRSPQRLPRVPDPAATAPRKSRSDFPAAPGVPLEEQDLWAGIASDDSHSVGATQEPELERFSKPGPVSSGESWEEEPGARAGRGSLREVSPGLADRLPTTTSISERFEAAPGPERSSSSRQRVQPVRGEPPTAAAPSRSARPLSGAGRLPSTGYTVETTSAQGPPVLREEPPHLSTALRHLTSGRLDLALQCVFQLGNERSLLALLQRLDGQDIWARLPEAEATYLARLLSALLRRDPAGASGREALTWLESLLRRPGAAALLPPEEVSALQAAVFSLSSVPGEMGTRAASLYYQLASAGQLKSPVSTMFHEAPFRHGLPSLSVHPLGIPTFSMACA